MFVMFKASQSQFVAVAISNYERELKEPNQKKRNRWLVKRKKLFGEKKFKTNVHP